VRRTLWLAILAASLCGAVSAPEQAALDRISAASMRGNLSFLASDALEGRATPSHGLTVAAEFIASCFRRAGLQPLAKDYLQTADLIAATPNLDDFQLTLTEGREQLKLTAADVSVHSLEALNVQNAAVTELPSQDPIEGRIVAAEARGYETDAALEQLRARKPSLILLMDRRDGNRDPEGPFFEEPGAIPVLRIFNGDAESAVAERRPLTVSLHASAPERADVHVSNVIGMLPGSDPVLRDEYIVVSAHYDHLGIKNGRIYNGANDNGSGVVSVIEIAQALASLAVHPKRSIIFAAFFGEEEGLYGSRWYTQHPPEPLKSTVANINLEQMGRTDEQDGAEVGAFAFTGPSYSSLPALMTAAARTQGVKVYNKRGADSFYDRSDNYPFAQAGVVAHTVVVAFEYPDYHGPGDRWEKIDYDNMARVDRAVAAGILQVANDPTPPKRR
jgi:hypothetical protein